MFNKDNVAGMVFAILAFILILLFTKHGGIGISPDSIAYVSVARKFTSGYGLTGYNERPFVLFPLFYPFFLSIPMFFSGQDIVALAPVLNGLLFAAVCFFSASMLKVNKWLKWATLLTLVLSIALLEVYTMLWSETLFILFTVFFIITLSKYLSAGQLKYLIAAAVLASVACVTRYAAVTVLASGLLLLFVNRQKPFKKRVADCLIFGSIGVSLLVFNLFRNYLLTNNLTGKRQSGITPFFKNIERFGGVFAEWFSPFKTSGTVALCIGLTVLIGFTILYLKWVYKHVQHGYLYIASGFFTIYAWFMVISSSVSRYEPINSRLLSPLFIPFLIIVANLFQKLSNAYKFKMIGIAGVCIMLVFSGFQAQTDIVNFKEANEGGIGGYTDDSWKDSPLLHFLQRHKQILTQEDFTVYSNASQAVYFYTGASTDGLPERKYKDDVRVFNEEDEFYLVWFSFEENNDLLNLKEIAQKNTLQPLHVFSDGVIFHCRARP